MMKKTFLLIIFVNTFASMFTNKNTNAINISSNPQEIDQISNYDNFLSKRKRLYFFENIKIPNNNNAKSSCHYIWIKKYFQINPLEKKFLIDQIFYSKERIFPYLIKNKSLELHLLENGCAYVNTNKNTQKIYLEKEALARDKKRGIWNDKYDAKLKYISFWNTVKRSKSQEFFSTRIKKFFPDLSFETKKKKILKFQDIIFPSQKGTEAEICIFKETQKYLHTLLYDKQVLVKKLKKDSNYHIYIPQKKKFPLLLHINEKMIEDGYGKLSPSYNKREFSKEIEEKQKNAYIHGKGAWGKCAGLIKNLNKNPEQCLIKGNITGTKSNPIKKYHSPNSPWYERVKAEKCFQNEFEALENGFIKVE